ncbi:MAG: hypothetical protein JSV91_03755, partial [Phycisphaerales bacterium]
MTMSGSEPARYLQPTLWNAVHESPGPLIWRLDARGEITSRPAADGPANLWLHSEALERTLSANVGRWLDATDAAPHELFEGCALVPVARADRAELKVALIIEPAALDSGELAAICEEQHVDPAMMRRALEPFVFTRDNYVRQLSGLISQASSDREMAAQSEFAANDLAKQLADVYEQITFLFRLSREMTTLD